jgi:large subunit ribosomal protein L7/L12
MVDLEKLIKDLSSLTLMDAAKLVEGLEKKWGIKAGNNQSLPGSNGENSEKEKVEQTEFNVELSEVGMKKIPVIKAVREITGLGLKEAKGFVDTAPKIIKSGISKKDAELIKSKLESQGAVVKIS